jgi:hypothetical protein
MKFGKRESCNIKGYHRETFTEMMEVSDGETKVGHIFFTNTWGKPRFVELEAPFDYDYKMNDLREIADKMDEEYYRELPNREKLHPDTTKVIA